MSGFFDSIIDWDTCKIQYELLGESLERVAAIHNIPIESIRRVALDENWRKTDDYEAYLDNAEEAIRRKLKLAVLLRDMDLFPQITELENNLIDKVRSATNNIDTTDPRAAGQLRALGQCINSLLDRPMPQLIINNNGEKLNPRDLMWQVEFKEVETKLEEVSSEQKTIGVS